MKRINMNDFAVNVALEEAGAEESNIAEIKQILKITMEILGGFENEQIFELIERYRKHDK